MLPKISYLTWLMIHFWGLGFLLCGCISQGPSIVAAVATPSTSPTPTEISRTPSPTSTPSHTVSPTKTRWFVPTVLWTPPPTWTPNPNVPPQRITPPTPLPGWPPTWTPLPTYSFEQARYIVMDLYEHNPCKLPCWWGITPGKTDWREAWQFLGRFAKNRPPWETVLRPIPFGKFIPFRVYLDVPRTSDWETYRSLDDLKFNIDIKTFRVDYIDVNTGNVAAYTIPEILAEYGMPKQIYVYGFPSPLDFNSGVNLNLYYPQYGFISSHYAIVKDDEWHEPTFTACFQKLTQLMIWPPERNLDFSERWEISDNSGVLQYMKTIDQVSNYSLVDFYRAFANRQRQPCIEFNYAGFDIHG
jgi:hypothetical protein